MVQSDYSIKLKEQLNNLVTRIKNSAKVFLSTRIINKLNKMGIPNDTEGQIKLFILKISLYFIKNDGFINEKYFILIW